GLPFMDFGAFDVGQLHDELGYNLVLPLLPLHGHRKPARAPGRSGAGDAFLSFDLVNTVHGLAQAVWDVRRIIGWVRAQGATSVGLFGVSLGAYVAALVAGVVDGLDRIVAGIPVS